MTAFWRKLYKDFLYVPKHKKGRVQEKVMLTRVVLSITVILFCMAAMSATAYAFFAHSMYSNVGEVRTASWSITVTAGEDVPVQDGVYTLDNTAGDAEHVYTFTVAKDAAATASVGYVKVAVITDADNGAEQAFYTQPIGSFLLNGEMTEDPDRQVCIRVPAGKRAQVEFVGEWGSCSKEPILEEGEAVEPAFAATVQQPDTTTTTTATTTTTETTTEATTTTTQTTTSVETATTTETPAVETQAEATQATTLAPEEDNE